MTPEEFEFKKRKAAALLRLRTTRGAPDLGSNFGVNPDISQPGLSFLPSIPPAGESLGETAMNVLASDLNRIGAAGLGLGETLSFGMDDPLAGLVNYLTGSAPSVAAGIEQNKAVKQAAAESAPGAYAVGQVGGMAVPAVALETALARAAGPAAKTFNRVIAQPALAGGAVSGAQSVGEDIGEGRAPDSVLADTLLGAGASALGSGVVAGVPAMMRGILPRIGIGAEEAAKAEAARRLISEAGAYGGAGRRVVDPETGIVTGGIPQGALLADAQAARPEMVLADLNPFMRNELLAAASNRRAAPEALGALSAAMRGREEDFLPMVREGIKNILPDYVSTSVHKEGMEAALGPLQAQYTTILKSAPELLERDAAYSLVDDILTNPSSQVAEVRATLKATIDRATPQIGKVQVGVNKKGAPIYEPVYKPMSADDVLALKIEADGLYERFADVPGADKAMRGAVDVKKAVSEVLDTGVPGYRPLADQYAEPLTYAAMRERGMKAATSKKGTVEDLSDYLDTLSQAEKDAFREGYRDALQAQIERGEVAFLRRVEGGNTRELERIRALFGDKTVNDLTNFASQVSAMRATTEGVKAATKSAQFGQANQGAAEAAGRAADIGDLAAGVLNVSLPQMAGAQSRRLLQGQAQGQRAGVSNQIANWMSKQGPQEMEAAIEEIYRYLGTLDRGPGLPRRALGQTFGAVTTGPNGPQ